MFVTEVKHKRKSAIITAIILLLLLFGIFNFGMQYLDPPEEYGVAINFGTSEFGEGVPVKEITKNSISKSITNQEQVKEVVVETPKEALKESLLTEDTSKDVPVVEKIKGDQEVLVKEDVQKKVSKPKVSKETQDALRNLLQGASAKGTPKEEGDVQKPGVKGNQKGLATSSAYTGNSGDGFHLNYNLAGRKVLSTPKEQPDCQEEGTVVVRIQVDKNGKVIDALPGVKGTTNSAPCLLKPAKEAALRTQWNADSAAPSKQVGTIIYTFYLIK
jgi:outer membrane biosynthesis protein TonB